ncbi:MAG: PQQ-binding-like beta-propeller repeat protein [Nitrososphaerota archaeon]|nr:PQQ-binding-like beta-propeller repeat protein [Nitrososphaerota archaeon]
MKKSIILLIIMCGLCLSTLYIDLIADAQQHSSTIADWPMFCNNLAHTGVTSDIGPKQPTELWSYVGDEFEYFVHSSAVVVNGVVYVSSKQRDGDMGYIYAFNAYTGKKIWSYSADGAGWSSPAVSENVLYIGCSDNVYALNASTGNKLWNHPVGGTSMSSAAVVNGIVYIGSADSNVYAFDALTGNKIWNYTTYNSVHSSPAVVDEVVYVGSDDGNVYALNALTGAKLWNYTTNGQRIFYPYDRWVDGPNAVVSSPAVVNGVVYVGSIGGDVYALNASTGDKIWSYYTMPSRDGGGGDTFGVSASPAVSDGIVYIGSVEGPFYAFDALTGDQVWTCSDPAFWRILSSATVADGVVYVGSYWDVYAFNATSGLQLWNFSTTNRIRTSPCIYDGVLYIGSIDGTFYAIGTPLSAPPASDSSSFNVLLFMWVGLVVIIIVAVVLIAAFFLKLKKAQKLSYLYGTVTK